MIFAVIPAKEPSAAKSRLATALLPEHRRSLAKALVENTLQVVSHHPRVAQTIMVAPGSGRWDIPANVRWIADRNEGLNLAVEDGVAAAVAEGAEAVLILPTDLPYLCDEAIDRLLAPLSEPANEHLVVIAPDRFCEGTNALLLQPASIIRPAFGARSFERHQALARAMGIEPRIIIDARLSLDLDHPEDLRMLPAGLGASLLTAESAAGQATNAFVEARTNP